MSERRDRPTVLREAHVGAKQILAFLREYDRDSGGAVVGVQAHAPDIHDRIRPLVDGMRDLADKLEVELHNAILDEVRVTNIDAARKRKEG